MTKTLLLICLSTVDPSACTYDTALIRMRGPNAMIQQCAMSGQATLAVDPDAILGKRYAKIVCARLEARR